MLSKGNQGVGVLGLGSYLPEKILTNHDLEKMVDTSDEWITKRTGISERRVLDKDTPAYVMGVEAAKKAIDDAGLTPGDIDLVIVTTETPDYLTPNVASIIQKHIGAVNAAAFDLNAACSGMVYALTVAAPMIKTGQFKHILIVGCEGLSKATDWNDRNTCVLFGDGAGALVLGHVEDEYGIIKTYIGADGSIGDVITVPCFHMDSKDFNVRNNENKHTIWMDGGEVFKFAVKIMEQATLEAIKNTGIQVNDLKMLFPHQANSRIVDGALKRLGLSTDKVMNILYKYGNISSASIPVALDEASKSNKLSKGDYIVLVGFGGGLTWGAALLRWSKQNKLPEDI